jgi:hypothetical protein
MEHVDGAYENNVSKNVASLRVLFDTLQRGVDAC